MATSDDVLPNGKRGRRSRQCDKARSHHPQNRCYIVRGLNGDVLQPAICEVFCEMSAQLFLFGTEQRMPSVMHRDVSRNVSIMGWVRSASENRFSLKLPAMPPAAPAIESCLAEPTCY